MAISSSIRTAWSARLRLLTGGMLFAGFLYQASPAFTQTMPAVGQQELERKAAAIVARMSLEEKAGQMLNTSPPIPRLNIAAYQWWNEALHGVIAEPRSTNFPAPIALAATFDVPLVHDVASAITLEARAASDRRVAAGERYALMSGRNLWSPNINIFRDPRWGRGQETYGEDPYLTARLGVAYVTGIQGPNPAHPINIATPKHFAAHSGPERTRHRDDNIVSLHDLRDTYLPAFRDAVVIGHAGSIMCAYTALNGQPTCANDFLIRDTLRGAWGFTGTVVSDCDAVGDIWQHQKFVPDAAAASAVAVTAGIDNECTIDGFFDRTSFGRAENYVQAVKSGKLPIADLDRALVRNMAARMRMGRLFDDGRDAVAPVAAPDMAANGALALNAAERSMVLLKNDGVLPLSRGPLRIAVIGPLADGRRVLRSNYTSRDTSTLPSVLDGLRAALPKARITFVPAGESPTDGDVVPGAVLQTEDGKPGITVRFYDSIPRTTKPPRSLLEKATGVVSGTFAAQPSRTAVLENLNLEGLGDLFLPEGGKMVASGYLVPRISGTYRIGLRGSATTLTFDGKPIASVPLSPLVPPNPTLHTMALEAGRRYPVMVTAISAGLVFSELDWQRVSPDPIADMQAAANEADVVIAVVGITASLESEEGTQKMAGFDGGDRTSLDLPDDQRRLLEAARATGKPVIVVNMSGSAINLDWAKANAAAIVQAWYPGEAGGLAVGRTIAGLVNPAGRLPVTFYRDVAQLPAFNDYTMANRTYRYFAGKPVYPFGYGLSYTRFAYDNIKVRRRSDGGASVTVDLTNVGVRAGDEVAQLYLRFPKVSGAPNIALRGFQRVALTPKATREIRFELTARDLSSVLPDGKVRVAQGSYTVTVGGGLPDSGLPSVSASLNVASPIRIAD